MEIHGKVAVVTGASAGIGRATARLLAAGGAKVALVARSGDTLSALARELPDALPLIADMADANAVRAMIARAHAHYGRLDLLVNNAGQGYSAMIEAIDLPTYRAMYELNVIGPLVAMQAAIPIMRAQGGGMIVNISSGTSLSALPSLGAYSSSKRALNGLSLTARAELATDGIIVSLVYPFITLTDFADNRLQTGQQPATPTTQRAGIPPPDTAEYVAKQILAAIASEEAEHYVHDWMKQQMR